MKKVICYVSHYLIEHDELFLKSLCENGYETHLIAYTHIDLPKNISSIKNLNIHYKKIPDYFNSRKYSYPFLVPKFKKVLKSIKPDILHSGWTPKDGFMSALTKFHPHLSMPWGSEVMIHPYQNYLYKIINNLVFKTSDHITCDSQHVKNLIISDYKIPESKITVFPWGIDLSLFKIDEISNKRSELEWEDKIVLIMTRKFEEFYRIEQFIDIFYKCIKQNKNLRLFLLGSGSLEKQIFSKIHKYDIKDFIHAPGWINRNEMNNFLISSDIYVSNSYTDGSSVSLLEAMACGLSPIVTKIESIEEWVQHDFNGYIMDVDKPELMEESILKLANSSSKLSKFKEQNLIISKDKLDWNKNFDILQNIYFNLLK